MRIIRQIMRPEPEVLYLEPVFGCNYRCPFCIHGRADRFAPVKLGPELFEKLKPVIADVHHIHITGLGEPFLNPHLLDYLSYFKEKGRSYYINTNGSLIKDAHIEIMMASKSELSVSLDAGDRETYSQVRPGGSWERVVSCLKKISQIKAGRQSLYPLVYLTFHINGLNLTSLRKVPELGRKLGIEAVKFSWTQLPEKYRAQSVFRHQAEVNQIVQDISAQLRRAGIQVSSEAEFRGHVRGCWAVGPMFFVGANGSVAACCNRWLAIGDINQNGYHDIWNGMPRRKILLAVANGRPEQACGHCAQVRGVDYGKNEQDFFQPRDQEKTILAEKEKRIGRLPCLAGLDGAFRSGVAALLGQDFQAAVRIFAGLENRFPDYFEIKNNLAAAYCHLGNIDKCREILHGIEKIPHHGMIMQSNRQSLP